MTQGSISRVDESRIVFLIVEDGDHAPLEENQLTTGMLSPNHLGNVSRNEIRKLVKRVKEAFTKEIDEINEL